MKAGMLTNLNGSQNRVAMHFFRTRKKLWMMVRIDFSQVSRRNRENPNSRLATASSERDFYGGPGFDCRRNIRGSPPKCGPRIYFVRKSEQESNEEYL